MAEIRDCHYCNYASCENASSEVACYCEDGCYYSHDVKDSKAEASGCDMFMYCDSFPKY